MRTIRFDPAQLTDPQAVAWWQAWQKRSDKATGRAMKKWRDWLQQSPPAGGTRPPFDAGLQQTIWSELKEWLNENVYHFRCAYCEGPLDSDRYKGDAEHFRPKGRVTVRDAAAVPRIARCTLPDGTEIDHPGYFWLAYDWRNLVPACADCNSGFGKVDQFPVKAAHALVVEAALAGFAAGVAPAVGDGLEAIGNPRSYFLPPARLDDIESPLLLNPLNPAPGREPAEHLRYGVGGIVVALDGSELGAKSIEVYQLKRENLRRRRQEAQERLQLAYYTALGLQGPAAADGVLDDYARGRRDFSRAALDHLFDVQRDSQQRLARLAAGGAAPGAAGGSP